MAGGSYRGGTHHPPRTRTSRQADRIACVATSNGLDYWLDIHDPTLTWANSLPITGTSKGLLIAGIIEMALLNCKYVVAVQTLRSARSKWIPYEFGRVKAHRVASDDAAGWYHPAVRAAPLAEYFELGRKTYGYRPCTLPSPGNPWISLLDWIQARAHRLARPCSPVPTGILP